MNEKFYCKEAKNKSFIVQSIINGHFDQLHYYTEKEFKNWIKNIKSENIIFAKDTMLKEIE